MSDTETEKRKRAVKKRMFELSVELPDDGIVEISQPNGLEEPGRRADRARAGTRSRK